jgi:hypothetical protein
MFVVFYTFKIIKQKLFVYPDLFNLLNQLNFKCAA